MFLLHPFRFLPSPRSRSPCEPPPPGGGGGRGCGGRSLERLDTNDRNTGRGRVPSDLCPWRTREALFLLTSRFRPMVVSPSRGTRESGDRQNSPGFDQAIVLDRRERNILLEVKRSLPSDIPSSRASIRIDAVGAIARPSLLHFAWHWQKSTIESTSSSEYRRP